MSKLQNLFLLIHATLMKVIKNSMLILYILFFILCILIFHYNKHMLLLSFKSVCNS